MDNTFTITAAYIAAIAAIVVHLQLLHLFILSKNTKLPKWYILLRND